MIQLTPQMRLLLAVEPADFRNGIDGLVAVCRQRLEADPMTGALVFSNRRRKALKLLVYDGQGFWLAQKEATHSPRVPDLERVLCGPCRAHLVIAGAITVRPRSNRSGSYWPRIRV